MFERRKFVGALAGGAAGAACFNSILAHPWDEPGESATRPPLPRPLAGEDVFQYIKRRKGSFDRTLYVQILGAANDFKEGDEIVGVSAVDAASRAHARQLLSRTRLHALDAQPPHRDQLFALLQARQREQLPSGNRLDPAAMSELQRMTLGQLKAKLLRQAPTQTGQMATKLSSDVIACLVKLMSNAELISVAQKIFNPLPGSRIGSRGYLGARIQPNSPTDNLDDIRWQVFDGWSYATGDVLLGTNPVSSTVASVTKVELALKDILTTFQIEQVMPHCVLSHIDVQSQVERASPQSTAFWFQSIAGCDTANATFDISVEKMERHAASRRGRFGLYFETGQGADFTNGHGHGFDMVMHESRKYGFARVLSERVQRALTATDANRKAWVHLNDVAGFIGPEVFRTREQLVRCCLEDIVMGKLHGLCIGLDVCSTLHMDISLEDLDWCLEQIMPANPAYLMALPTKIDPMLGYLTTSFQDHVRLREKFGFRVDDRIWKFFQQLKVIDSSGKPTAHFGDPVWVYIQYRRRKGDSRSDEAIRDEGRRMLADVRKRGLFVAEGYDSKPWRPNRVLAGQVDRIYRDAKRSIWAELSPQFVQRIPEARLMNTRSGDRKDYILHPESGEKLSAAAVRQLSAIRRRQAGEIDLQIIVSDGLNALAIMEEGQLLPYLQHLRQELEKPLARAAFRVSTDHIVVESGRVRAGYRIGEALYSKLPGRRAILHVIGERPGTGHQTFSTYITSATGETWAAGTVDHNITKVVSGIALTALTPQRAATETARLVSTL